ncbi:fungal-specific transcription factor-like protein [Boeremia exigua]|uniref:fungal-specific transcription factor-like protein n=1 Tax=Boeremia exigua TaxID=749465 RepID=UPI001E8E7A6B|nr:fungal-specific transcription factor-like protein [Boeremia exigua]KAH6620267.1 fungal-specific transcription factor-like protein [Boeremia exigua]
MPDGLEMSQQKRPNEDVDHEDGKRPNPQQRTPRIRACAECKRHKIKCDPVDGEAKCAKCLRSGTECVPYNMNQRLLDEDAAWKSNAAAEIAQLRTAVKTLLRQNGLPDLEAIKELPADSPDSRRQSDITVKFSPGHSGNENGTAMVVPPIAMDMTRENSVERDSVEEADLVTAPMRSLYDLTRIRNLRSNVKLRPGQNPELEDFIAQGVVSLPEAEDLFRHYFQGLRLYLWGGVLCPYDSLDAVRRRSSLLTAVVLTIAALHTRGRDDALEKCYGVFVSGAYSACLSRVQSVDDIRALLLASFYLSNLSWKLSGAAVRNATEMNLHQSFNKLMRGQEDHRDKVRLWYVLYVCEHQLSIAYGRPPIIQEDIAIKNIEQFLDSPETKPGDIRLSAQVTLFKILTEAYIAYGSDPEQPLTEPDFQRLRMFNFAIEQWRLAWQARSCDSPTIGSYPSKGVVLYYHFARFQLNSLALRGLPPPSAVTSETLSYDRREAANIAITAATSTLTLIFEEPDLRRAMSAVPIFTHTMVAFCATFLLKMAKTWGTAAQVRSPESAGEPIGLGLNFNTAQVVSLARRSATFLAKVAENLSEKHLTRHIVHGINLLLKQLDMMGTPSSTIDHAFPAYNVPQSQHINGHFDPNRQHGVAAVDFGHGDMANTYNMYDLIGSYGFGMDEAFLGQVASTDLDFWPTENF